jgi:hypothetical protein
MEAGAMSQITHELKIYANHLHKTARHGELVLHLWFKGSTTMELDLDIALHRPDVAHVDLIDCINHTTKRLYNYGLKGGGDADERERAQGSQRAARGDHGRAAGRTRRSSGKGSVRGSRDGARGGSES